MGNAKEKAVLILDVSSSESGGDYPTSNLLSAHVFVTVPDDLFVSEEERARPIFRAGSDKLTQGTLGRAPFQNLFLKVLLHYFLDQLQILG